MRFFHRQQQSRRRTVRLVVCYVLALIGTVAITSAGLGSLPFLFGAKVGHSLWWYYLPPALFVCALTIGLSLHRLHELRRGGEAIAKRLGGEALQLADATFAERRLLNVVAETALSAGLPAPPVYLLRRDGSINAFAAGMSPRSAVIGVTQGAINLLTRDELQAIVAHEFSHIRNGDMRLNCSLAAWLHGLQGIASSGRYFLYGRDDEHYLEYRRRKNVDNHPFDNGVEIVMQSLPLQALGVLLIALGSAGSVFALWLQAAVCREREFMADASAVQLTRQTAPLIEALRKSARTASCRLASPEAPEYAHLMFGRIRPGGLAATHPPLIERIRRLDAAAARRLAGELADADSFALPSSVHLSFAAPQPMSAEAEEAENLYRQRQALMQARIRRCRPQPATREQDHLWLLLEAYLTPAPPPGRLAQHPAAEALTRAAELTPEQLHTAVNAALLLTDPAKTALLRPLAATLPASSPLLWRYLCVRLDVGAWHFGLADSKGRKAT